MTCIVCVFAVFGYSRSKITYAAIPVYHVCNSLGHNMGIHHHCGTSYIALKNAHAYVAFTLYISHEIVRSAKNPLPCKLLCAAYKAPKIAHMPVAKLHVVVL